MTSLQMNVTINMMKDDQFKEILNFNKKKYQQP